MNSSTDSIEGLIAKAKAGDNAALGRVLESLQAYLNLLARLKLNQRLKDKVSASDVVQETFLSAKKAFGRFRGHSERELMAWLRRILATEIAGQARYYARDRRSIAMEQRLCAELDQTSAAILKDVVDTGDSPSIVAAQREAEVVLATAISQLQPDQREVIILHNLQHRTFPEVAQSMGRSTAAVKSLWVRALANLRRTLARYDTSSHEGESQ